MGFEKETQKGGTISSFKEFVLGITNLFHGMIRFTLSISTHDFALSFPKRPYTNEDSIPHL